MTNDNLRLSGTKKETPRCPVCETLFFPQRSDAIYCSARCRKRAQRGGFNRVRNEKQSFYVQAQKVINELLSYGAHRQLRILAMNIIQELPDNERAALYEAIKSDIQRVNRDTVVTRGHGHEEFVS